MIIVLLWQWHTVCPFDITVDTIIADEPVYPKYPKKYHKTPHKTAYVEPRNDDNYADYVDVKFDDVEHDKHVEYVEHGKQFESHCLIIYIFTTLRGVYNFTLTPRPPPPPQPQTHRAPAYRALALAQPKPMRPHPTEPKPREPQFREPQPRDPWPRMLQPKDISLLESLAIVFYEALFSNNRK